jgi:F0F1-type ATP synthase membrane subunit c/vacuolar-type H+-ATPase subunit K
MFLFKKYLMIQAFKFLGAGCAVIALTGAGVGIGTIFGALILAVSRVPESLPKLL